MLRPTPRSCLTGLAAASLLFAAGCASDSAIDADLRALVSEQTRTLGPDTPAPRRDYPPDAGEAEPEASLEKTPATRNVPAAELEFTAADPLRDVAQTLERFADDLPPQDPSAPSVATLALDLPAVFQLTHESAREFLTAEEEYILAAIRLLIERHRFSPRFFNDTGVFVSGSEAENFRSALRVINDLRVSQQLPFGGEVAARWVTQATEQLRATAGGRYTQSSELVLSANIPLLRGAGDVAQESLIQAERDVVYASRTFERFRRSLLVSIARDYFDLLNTLALIRNQERQLDGFRRTEARVRALVEAGRTRPFELNIVSSQLLNSRANLESQRERYRLQLDRFKVRLGLPIAQDVTIEPFELPIPEPSIPLDNAGLRALEFRLDLQNRRDRVLDARRGVRNARNDTLPSLDLTGEVGLGLFGTDGPTDSIFDGADTDFQGDADDFRYEVGVTFGLPLDREIERLRVRQSIISLDRRERDYREFRDNVVVGARASVRNVELARFRLDLAERQVEINRRRLEEQELRADEVTAQQIVDTEGDLLDAENDRDQAQTDLRNAVLDYLLETGQLRVARDGAFEPLPGMFPGAEGEPLETP